MYLRCLPMLVFIALFVLAPNFAQAHTATKFFEVKVIQLPEKGSAMKVEGVLVLQNLFKKDAFLVILRHAGYYDVRGKESREISSKRMKVDAGGTMKVPFRFQLAGDGKHRVVMQVDVFSASGDIQVGHQPIDLYFKVKDGQYLRTTYQELYVPKIRESSRNAPSPAIDRTKKVAINAAVVPLPRDVKATFGEKRLRLHALPGPRGTISKGKLQWKIKPGDRRIKVPKVSPKLPNIQRSSNLQQELNKNTTKSSSWWNQMIDSFPAKTYAQTTYMVSGKFSYKGLDNNLHPGWNWYVKLWWKKPNGSWQALASRYIPPSGDWSLTFSRSGYTGQHLLIQYRAGSYFIMPQNQNNDEYWWQDPDQTNISTNFNIGHRVADTSSNGTLAGLGDVQNSAYLYWNKFTVNGVNPERSKAIRLFFPNTWYNCGGTSPWSCASVDGDIWLIAAHTDDFTIQHELSHQTNNEYWNNERPPGAGGPHNLNNCYNTGLALREGYANAVPHWVLDGENASNPNAGGFQLESPSSATVCNGDTNEVWVAGVFWDLLDRHVDGQDLLWFNNAVEVFSIYLGAGVKNGIKNYRTNYRNAASSGHQQYIDDIYENNTIAVP